MRGRRLSVVGAASSIGIRPYDDGTVRHLHRVPEALRAAGLVERLGADDLGDVNRRRTSICRGPDCVRAMRAEYCITGTISHDASPPPRQTAPSCWL